MANIYDDVIFSTTDAYSINDVVYVDDLGNTSGWHSRSYFYSLTDHAASTTYPNADPTNWGGWALAPVTSKYKPLFFWLPSYNVQSNHEPRVKKITLGDGYEQRSPDGLNNTLLDLQLSFELRTQKEATAMLHFLEIMGGSTSFLFTPTPPLDKQKRFICPSWTSTYVFFDNYTIAASFKEVAVIN